MDPISQQRFLKQLHRNIDRDFNLEVLFSGTKVGGIDFLSLYRDCMSRSGTTVPTWKTFRRAQRAFNLARYFDYALSLEGDWVECGVAGGFSAVLLANVAKSRDPKYSGRRLHLIDSFEGLSEPTVEDAIPSENQSGHLVAPYGPGHFKFSVKHLQRVMKAFPDREIYRGWIPDVFAKLPDRRWSFVHVDVDLYEPTRDCVEYFLPRLMPGGVMINDDFSSPMFPGGGRGWHECFNRSGLSYLVLDTGQAVYVAPS